MKGYSSSLPLFDHRKDLDHYTVQPADPNVREADKSRLSRKNLAVLRRLQEGPATTLELMGPRFGIRPGARVFDLGEAGCRIKSERVKDGIALYTLLECPEELS